MQTVHDILSDIEKSTRHHRSNTQELIGGWNDFVLGLKTEFTEITIADEGDTVCLGELSPGCIACKTGGWDCVFITPLCNLKCAFCISPFLPGSKLPFSSYGKTMEETVQNYRKTGITGISFSGGEPFLRFPQIVARLESFKRELPDNYFWLYTNGVLVQKEHIDILAQAGIHEIRYNTAAAEYDNENVLRIMEYSAKKIENVTVEIPVIRKDEEILLSAIPLYADAGVKYLNLHELMKEDHTPSQDLVDENFKKFTFNDGHTTQISMDSRWIVKGIVRMLVDSKTKIHLNFCSAKNKLRQIRKRRNHMIKLLKESHEKTVDEECLETVLAYRDKNTYQFVHPDDWQTERTRLEKYQAVMLKKMAPLSVFEEARYISAQKLS